MPLTDITIAQVQAALRAPARYLADPRFRSGVAVTGPFGLPKPSCGKFACVWRLNAGAREFALRTFRGDPEERLGRLRLVQEHLARVSCSSVVTLEVQRSGIRIGRAWQPLVVMDWIDGVPLPAAIEARLRQPGQVRALSGAFRKAIEEMERCGIGHQDLHPGNILVRPDGTLALIDHDAMYVPSMQGLGSLERGHSHFSSPSGRPRDFGLSSGRFAAHLIEASLLILAEDPALWMSIGPGNPKVDPAGLLLRERDLRDPLRSPALSALLGHTNPRVRQQALRLRALASVRSEELAPFRAPVLASSTTGALPAWYRAASSSEVRRYRSVHQ